MIVLNGMPFIKASLTAIYDSAYEIIIVEGAVRKCMFAANSDGSSVDGTVEFIKSFPDPKNKIRLIQGKWLEKCNMQNRALKFITGDWVWLVDSDEVYKKEDIDLIIEFLKNHKNITQVNLPPIHFWKGGDYALDSEILEKSEGFRRIFKVHRPCHFVTHRPPTMRWGLGHESRTTDKMEVLNPSVLSDLGVFLYHYSYINEVQVKQKIELYKRYGWGKAWKIDLDDWYKNCFLKWTPETRHKIELEYGIWTCDKNSRTKLFSGKHPKSVRGLL